MVKQMLHVFRNTPFGREIFLQSLYFSKMTRLKLDVFFPEISQFIMFFEHSVVTVNLDKAFLSDPDTAQEHALEIAKQAGVSIRFFQPNSFTAGRVPTLPVDFKMMCYPRSISDLSTRIGLGYIGPRVRTIIRNAEFPVLIPSTVYKEWKSITVFFGGSKTSINALRIGLEISKKSKVPMQIWTQDEKDSKDYYLGILKKEGLLNQKGDPVSPWWFFSKGKFRPNLYDVPHDSLLVIGSFGHNLMKDVLFGSKAEMIQTVMPNNLLIVGMAVK